MTEAERAAALADEIEAELKELRERFRGRENDSFSFGLRFSSWDVIARALRLLASQEPAPADIDPLRETLMRSRERAHEIASSHDWWAEGPTKVSCGKCGMRIRAGMIDVGKFEDLITQAIEAAVEEATK